MDIETAGKSIGKKVVYTGRDLEIIYHLGSTKYGTISKTIDGGHVGVYNIHGSEMYLKSSELEFVEMREHKIGDKVVLNPETKPYTFHRHGGGQKEIEVQPNDELDYRITHIYNDGDVDISAIDGSDDTSISPHHLKHVSDGDKTIGTLSVDLDYGDLSCIELRLAIFNGNPSRTLQEMQDIEKWLLNR